MAGDTEPPSCIVDVIIHEDGWNAALPDAELWANRVVRTTLLNEELADSACEMACVLSNDEELQALNLKFRQKDKPTNVLSFPSEMDDEDFTSIEMMGEVPYVLGDVVISLETLQREAKEQDKDFRNHATHMLVHGVMHLLGYDHEVDAEAEVMEAREVTVLSALKIADPYQEIVEKEGA